MILLTVLLVLTGLQLNHCETSGHCHTHRKIKPVDIVRSINRSPKTTWKASTYGLKEADLNTIAQTKLGVKMDDLRLPSASELRKLEKEAQLHPEITDLPENFSWANTNRTKCSSEIRDQSNCGSCWAVATASAFSDRYCIQTNGTFTTPFSHQYLLSCTDKYSGCDGGYMNRVLSKLQNNGTVTGGEYESDQGCQTYTIRPCGPFEYDMPCDRKKAMTPTCQEKKCNNDWYELKEEQSMYKISSYTWMDASYRYDFRVRQEIYNSGPAIALFWVYPDFMFYKSGIYVHKSGWYPLGGHAVKIVGWGIENGTKYWHAENSWGKYWGEKGYFRIRRGLNECSFENNIIILRPLINNSTSSG